MHACLPAARVGLPATLEILRGKTSRVKLREHDAETLEGQQQTDAGRGLAQPEPTPD